VFLTRTVAAPLKSEWLNRRTQRVEATDVTCPQHR